MNLYDKYSKETSLYVGLLKNVIKSALCFTSNVLVYEKGEGCAPKEGS